MSSPLFFPSSDLPQAPSQKKGPSPQASPSPQTAELPCFRSTLLKSPHGFFTRQGGISREVYKSLNFASQKESSDDIIKENRRRVTDHFHKAPESLCIPFQVHQASVHMVTHFFVLDPIDQRPKADALVTQNPEFLIGITSADCVPLLIEDSQTQIVAAIHAGWKGVLAGVVEATLKALQNQGSPSRSLRVAIGPCIRYPHYEVGPEVKNAFLQKRQKAEHHFTPSPTLGYFLFDLPSLLKDLLQDLGISLIDDLNQDTYSQEDLFFSCRRAFHQKEEGFGTHLSAICVPSSC